MHITEDIRYVWYARPVQLEIWIESGIGKENNVDKNSTTRGSCTLTGHASIKCPRLLAWCNLIVVSGHWTHNVASMSMYSKFTWVWTVATLLLIPHSGAGHAIKMSSYQNIQLTEHYPVESPTFNAQQYCVVVITYTKYGFRVSVCINAIMVDDKWSSMV